MLFKSGDSLGSYSILRLIGVGFMGEVYQAIHQPTGQEVALKCLQTRHLEDPEMVERARREAVALSEIRHANIVLVHEAGVTDHGVVWMAMELLVGKSLRKVMVEHKQLPVLLALHYACEIADGVDAAHEYSIVHRDLKPENVFVTESNGLRVLDLGTAKFFGQGLDTTGRAQVFGTVPYMSPEHLAGERVDARTDVYALGMLLYEMLAGKHPFAAHFESILELGRAQMFQMPKALPEVVAGMPYFIWSLIEKAIQKDREARYLSMSDFARAIRNARRRYEREVPGASESRPSFETPAPAVSSDRRDYVALQPAQRQSSDPGPAAKSSRDSRELLAPRSDAGAGASPGAPPQGVVPFRAVGKTIVMKAAEDAPREDSRAESERASGASAAPHDREQASQSARVGPYGTQVLDPAVRAAMVAKAYSSVPSSAAPVASTPPSVAAPPSVTPPSGGAPPSVTAPSSRGASPSVTTLPSGVASPASTVSPSSARPLSHGPVSPSHSSSAPSRAPQPSRGPAAWRTSNTDLGASTEPLPSHVRSAALPAPTTPSPHVQAKDPSRSSDVSRPALEEADLDGNVKGSHHTSRVVSWNALLAQEKGPASRAISSRITGAIIVLGVAVIIGGGGIAWLRSRGSAESRIPAGAASNAAVVPSARSIPSAAAVEPPASAASMPGGAPEVAAGEAVVAKPAPEDAEDKSVDVPAEQAPPPAPKATAIAKTAATTGAKSKTGAKPSAPAPAKTASPQAPPKKTGPIFEF